IPALARPYRSPPEMSSKKHGRHDHHLNLMPVLAGLMIVLTVVGVIAVLVNARQARTEPSAVGGGRLVASEATVNLGRVPFDTLAEARFELSNSGAETVRLVGPPRVRMLEGC